MHGKDNKMLIKLFLNNILTIYIHVCAIRTKFIKKKMVQLFYKRRKNG